MKPCQPLLLAAVCCLGLLGACQRAPLPTTTPPSEMVTAKSPETMNTVPPVTVMETMTAIPPTTAMETMSTIPPSTETEPIATASPPATTVFSAETQPITTTSPPAETQPATTAPPPAETQSVTTSAPLPETQTTTTAPPILETQPATTTAPPETQPATTAPPSTDPSANPESDTGFAPTNESTTGSTEPSLNRGRAEEAFQLQNQILIRHDVTPLQWSESLYQIAAQRAKEITADYSHNGCPDWVGENILMGTDRADLAIQIWYDSPGHQRNMLAGWTYGAVANYGYYWVALYAMTETP